MFKAPVRFDVKKSVLSLFFVAFLSVIFIGCNLNKEYLFYGNTMGTTYHIKVVAHGFSNPSHLKDKISQRLDQINQSMSTYIKDSEISRFNQSADVDSTHEISDDFLYVMKASRSLYELTNGAWDGTIKPLIDLWGFTKHTLQPVIPDPTQIKNTLDRMGFDKIIISEKGSLKKRHPLVTVDLASIAKGFGVDAVAWLIRENGYTDFIVEIGGEVYASGRTKEGTAWKVGINTPDKDAAFNMIYKAVDLENKAVATSGDYRNFFEVDGKRYSHILNPRTGYPITNRVVSATIISDTCTFADGLATAIMVMGAKDGLALINRLDHTEGLIITREPNGSFTDHASEGFIN